MCDLLIPATLIVAMVAFGAFIILFDLVIFLIACIVLGLMSAVK